MNRVLTFRSRKSGVTSLHNQPDCLADCQLSSAFQPIYSPTHQRLVGYEALARVRRQGKPESPAALFARAEACDRTTEVDQRLMREHLLAFAARPQQTWLFINISPATCGNPETALQRLAKDCEDTGIEPSRIVLEVVETATRDMTSLLDFVTAAKALGFQIAIDDFGVGDSNFERMWQLQPLIVKIDRSLLVNAEQHRRARLLLESLVKMIRESGSLVLLEGIENEAQARLALATEADLLQGFLFGRPEPLPRKPDADSGRSFAQHVERFHRHSQRDVEQHEGYLRLLRFELLEACHRLLRDEELAQACNRLLDVNGVQRCFLLDADGVQQGGLASTTPERHSTGFNPLYQSGGARWGHREYFTLALQNTSLINACRPYVALPDAVRTITLSCYLQVRGRAMVFCTDLHPDEVFDGQLGFPGSL